MRAEKGSVSSPAEVLFGKSAAKSLICMEISSFFANITYFLELMQQNDFTSMRNSGRASSASEILREVRARHAVSRSDAVQFVFPEFCQSFA